MEKVSILDDRSKALIASYQVNSKSFTCLVGRFKRATSLLNS